MMKQDVHMAKWIRQVWGWQKHSRKSEGYVVLHSTSHLDLTDVIQRGSTSRPDTGTDSRPSSSREEFTGSPSANSDSSRKSDDP